MSAARGDVAMEPTSVTWVSRHTRSVCGDVVDNCEFPRPLWAGQRREGVQRIASLRSLFVVRICGGAAACPGQPLVLCSKGEAAGRRVRRGSAADRYGERGP